MGEVEAKRKKEVQISNTFEALKDTKEVEKEKNKCVQDSLADTEKEKKEKKQCPIENNNLKVTTKEWVTQTFGEEETSKNQQVVKPENIVKDKTESDNQVTDDAVKQKKQDDGVSKELVVAKQQHSQGLEIIKNVIPLALQAKSQIQVCNTRRKELDKGDLGKNINNVAREGNLSPMLITKMKASHGLQKRQYKVDKTSPRQTRRSIKHKSK